MTPEAQRIAIAEACGWQLLGGMWHHPIGGFIPDYLNDLNAMHEPLRQSGYSWTIHTCDAGYRVLIFKSPEQGEDKLADCVGDELCPIIAEAFLKAKGLYGRNYDPTPH